MSLHHEQYKIDNRTNSLSVKETHPIIARVINKLHNKINSPIPITSKINEETKIFLDNYFYKEMEGIDELVDKNILSKWFPKKTLPTNVYEE
ncbi:MAG: hypothetical protein GY834_04800 [Bacteroidetes bacterium]|nr:hypothetical protein [Bacteroidota bacterium]